MPQRVLYFLLYPRKRNLTNLNGTKSRNPNYINRSVSANICFLPRLFSCHGCFTAAAVLLPSPDLPGAKAQKHQLQHFRIVLAVFQKIVERIQIVHKRLFILLPQHLVFAVSNQKCRKSGENEFFIDKCQKIILPLCHYLQWFSAQQPECLVCDHLCFVDMMDMVEFFQSRHIRKLIQHCLHPQYFIQPHL